MYNENHGKGFLEEQAKSKKYPIREVSNLAFSMEVLGAWSHISKEEHSKVYEEHV